MLSTVRAAELLHHGDDGLALVAKQEHQRACWLRGAGVLRLVDVFGRKMRRVPNLQGHWRVPVVLEDQCALQDIDQLGPRMKVPSQRTTWDEIGAIHQELSPLSAFQVFLLKYRA